MTMRSPVCFNCEQNEVRDGDRDPNGLQQCGDKEELKLVRRGAATSALMPASRDDDGKNHVFRYAHGEGLGRSCLWEEVEGVERTLDL
jgi:hypothetical protein